MRAFKLCNVCGVPAMPGSHWCAEHRDLFYRAGRCPDAATIAEQVYAIIRDETARDNVTTVEDIAARLDCTAEDVRAALQALRRDGKALPWLPGPMRHERVAEVGS